MSGRKQTEATSLPAITPDVLGVPTARKRLEAAIRRLELAHCALAVTDGPFGGDHAQAAQSAILDAHADIYWTMESLGDEALDRIAPDHEDRVALEHGLQHGPAVDGASRG